MLTLVYDVQSVSGAALAQISYRVNSKLSITFAASLFYGRQQLVDMPINPIAPGQDRTGDNAYKDSFEGAPRRMHEPWSRTYPEPA